jgi:transglutaminase-like putative cysteine protease
VLIMERSIVRLVLNLGLMLLIVLAAGWGAQSGVLPRPEPQGGGLGLTGKPEGKQQENKHGQGKGKDRRDNDNLEFRDQEQNKDKQTPVAVVLLHDDYSPPTGIYYFRQGAFSQFNGRRLIGTTRDGLDRDVLDTFPVDELVVPDAPEANSERATLESTVALLADHTRPFGLESPVSFEAAQNPNPERFKRVYKVVSAALTGDFMTMMGRQAGSPKWSAEDRAEYLALPPDPRYAELAQKIASDLPPELAKDPMLKAWSVSEWLSKEGTYSLKSKHASATDPTAHFLFGDKVGYCVHFAHAATYLMRALGVPARVATGYAEWAGSSSTCSRSARSTRHPSRPTPTCSVCSASSRAAFVRCRPTAVRPAPSGKTGSPTRRAGPARSSAAAWCVRWSRSTWPSSGVVWRPASRPSRASRASPTGPSSTGWPRWGSRAVAASRERRLPSACTASSPASSSSPLRTSVRALARCAHKTTAVPS